MIFMEFLYIYFLNVILAAIASHTCVQYFCAKQENWQQCTLIYSEVRTQIEIVQYTPVNWKLYKNR